MDGVDADVPAGFDLVADETRAAILFALAERMRDHPDDPALGFAELRKRAGVRDSGNFNYHLGRLRGQFVQEGSGGEGYALTYPGIAVVSALVGGEYEATGVRGPERYGEPCPICDEPLFVVYDDGILGLRCDGDARHGMGYNLPPHVVDDVGLVPAVELMVRRAYADISLIDGGRCSSCFGPVHVSLDEPDEPDVSPAFHAICTLCGMPYQLMIGHATVHHPEVVSFYADHDVDIRSDPVVHLSLARADAVRELDGEDRGFLVTIASGGDELVVTVDDEGVVQSVERG